jgi:Tol biopolymer transport system component
VPDGAVTPSWSPDGTTIAFSRYNDQKFGEIYLMNADGSGLRQVTTCDQKACSALDPAWAPDGSLILFDTSSGAIDSVNPDGSNLTVLEDDGRSGEPAWQPMG